MKSFSPTLGDTVDGRMVLADAPLNRSAASSTLALTTDDAEIALAVGVYVALADAATDTAVLGLGNDTTGEPPASGDPEAESVVVIPVGGIATLLIDRALTLHARVLSGTATLRLVRKSV